VAHCDSAVAVVTDSAASLPPGAREELGIAVVPMTVVIEDHVYADEQLAPAELVRRAGQARVRTSAPSPGAYLDALAALGDRQVLVTTVARGMSASYESAVTATGYTEDGRVGVLDTETAAGGQGLVVMAAARAACAGGSLDEVTAAARHAADRVHLLAVLDQLDFLVLSGRVPGIAARAGRSLGLRAVFEFSRGRVRSRRPARGIDSAIERIVASCNADGHPGAQLHAAVLDAESPSAAGMLMAAVRRLTPDADVYAAPFSSVLVAHTGPGLAGLAWWWEPQVPSRQAAVTFSRTSPRP
jgi:DegV family protein with EDD domain